jgi:hypothetical protein
MYIIKLSHSLQVKAISVRLVVHQVFVALIVASGTLIVQLHAQVLIGPVNLIHLKIIQQVNMQPLPRVYH